MLFLAPTFPKNIKLVYALNVENTLEKRSTVKGENCMFITPFFN